MHAPSDVGGDVLQWVKPRWTKLQFELRAGEVVIATLAWVRGSRAVGTWSDGSYGYHFSREGWFRPRILVRGGARETAVEDAVSAAREPEEPIATFACRGNTLAFSDGREFFWKRPKRLTAERIWVDRTATVLVRFKPARWNPTAAVMVEPAAKDLPESALLILLGQYLVVLAAQDAVAASTAGTVAVIASSS